MEDQNLIVSEENTGVSEPTEQSELTNEDENEIQPPKPPKFP